MTYSNLQIIWICGKAAWNTLKYFHAIAGANLAAQHGVELFGCDINDKFEYLELKSLVGYNNNLKMSAT